MGARKGFTLLEVLVAMALLVIVVAALYSTYFGLLKGRETAAAGMESRREWRAALDMLHRELAAAFYVSGNKRLHFIVEDRDEFGKPASTLEFTSFVPPRSGDYPHSDQVAISYKPEVKEGKMTLMRQARDLYVASDPVPYPQVEELEGFLVECLNGDKWVRSWDTAVNGRLPKAVRVTLRTKEGDRVFDLATVASPEASD